MREPGRNFTLLDAMIVIAATAISIAWTRVTAADILERSTDGVPAGVRFPMSVRLMWWLPISVPALVPATSAVLVLRLRRPRPGRRRLACQPGATACASVTLVLALQAFILLLDLGLKQVPGMTFARSATALPTHWAIVRGQADIGLVVLGAWLVLAWGRRWRPEATWVDRLGRFIGACWIALFLIQRSVMFLMAA